MQNRYVGDLGDFGKYGMLRQLARSTELPMGINWYLHPDQDHLNDGRQTGYLNPLTRNLIQFRDLDPALYDTLRGIVEGGTRNVAKVRKAGILPPETTFFEDTLEFSGVDRGARDEARQKWIQRGLEATESAGVIFLDPDNGISQTVSATRRDGTKYCYPSEILQYLERGQSVIVYHHLGRQAPAWQQISDWKTKLSACFGLSNPPIALRYRRGSPRAYIIVTLSQHRTLIQNYVERFAHGPWSQHFQLA